MQAKAGQGTGGVRQEVDSDTQFRHLRCRLEQHALHAGRVQLQGHGEAAYAGSGDDDGRVP